MFRSDGEFSIIVGGEDMVGEVRYEFYSKAEKWLGDGYFKGDGEAEVYCKSMFPHDYATGMEMRCYDGCPPRGGEGAGAE